MATLEGHRGGPFAGLAGVPVLHASSHEAGKVNA